MVKERECEGNCIKNADPAIFAHPRLAARRQAES
jgi:hypothetical protein